MEEKNLQGSDRFASNSSPSKRVEHHAAAEQSISPKDERVVSVNASPVTAMSAVSVNVKDQPVSSETSAAFPTMYPSNSYTPPEQSFYYGGYDNSSGNWAEHSNEVNPNNLQAVYNDNSSFFFPPSYGYDAQMAYGQFSPIGGPLSPIMIDGQLYSPHQVPISPSYYPPISPGPPHVSQALPASQSELIMPPGSGNHESFGDGMIYGPGSGYYMPFGSFTGGELPGNSNIGFYKFQNDFRSAEQPLTNRPNSVDSGRYASPLTSAALYPQQFGLLGSYEQNVAQGLGYTPGPSTRHYIRGGSYPSSNYASGSSWEAGNQNRFATAKGFRSDREQGSTNISSESLGVSSERSRGPRALKLKNRSSTEENSLSGVLKDLDHVNRPEFVVDYEQAKFFVIKSFSEDNVHKSIKYKVWSSTPLGNRKLDAAYREAKDLSSTCPVFLFFSVNASGQFCGVAEMEGPIDFEKDAEYWQQDRWSGQFPVKWHFIKDVPNIQFRHILLENNDNKPVTHSRDSQEVKLEQGIEMLKIFKDYDAEASMLDDFTFYNDREKALLERKAKQRAVVPKTTAAASSAADTVNHLADSLADSLQLEGGSSKQLPPKDGG
ncbi:unnamed protein product [Cuscuta epithymum]|uniref:YTH domain-containing family protein n=1 Tax=Cuscuta epithymum TaxID=186058 RepID=A0AAV0CIB2_9ASTE|nr:unnamed protein product [Cuscuta epithymum]